MRDFKEQKSWNVLRRSRLKSKNIHFLSEIERKKLKERKEMNNHDTELFVADLRSTFDDFYVFSLHYSKFIVLRICQCPQSLVLMVPLWEEVWNWL